MPSDDSFTVMIANLTNNTMNPASSNLEWGAFGSEPVSIPANTNPAIEAFEVYGKVASGPQGTVNYNIDNLVQAVCQFNSNVGGNADGSQGDYFYAGLQPQQAGDDTSGYYLQVSNFSIPTADGQTSFTPTVTVYPNDGTYNLTPLAPPTGQTGWNVFELWMVNSTEEVITLNQLTAPLNFTHWLNHYKLNLQPAIATTIVPQTAAQLFATQLGAIPTYPSGANLEVVYNLAGGTTVTISYDWQNSAPASATMGGANTSRYMFQSTTPTVQQKSGYQLIQLTVTLSLSSTSMSR
jgi:hypothetical protein